MASAAYGSLPFQEQIHFFRRKLNVTTESWTDVYAAEHDNAFMVAGANRDDLVTDFRTAVERAITEGRTLEDFRKDFDRIVAEHGWDYTGGRNWRSRVIYETNLRTSYMAGRYEQLQFVKAVRPYWQYVHSDAVEMPRPIHQSWNGLIIHADDPWWQWHFPINAWGCQCTVIALSLRDLRDMGRDGPDQAPAIEWEERTIGQRSPGGPRVVRVPRGIDPGFEYAPGRSRLNGATPAPVRSALAEVDPGRMATDAPVDPDDLPMDGLPPPGLDQHDYIRRFLEDAGAWDEPRVLTDPMGERLAIGTEMFRDDQGAPALPSAELGPLLPLLVPTVQSAAEVWVAMSWLAPIGRAVMRRRYIARYRHPETGQPFAVVMEVGRDGWTAVVAGDGEAELLSQARRGVRVYRRGSD